MLSKGSVLLALLVIAIPLTSAQSSDGGWYIKGSREPWTGPSPLSSSSLTGPSPLSFSSSKPSFSSSGASRIQTSTTRSILFPRTTPKYKSLSAKEFQRLKSTSSKRKTTTKNVGAQFSAPSVELTTPSSTRRRKPALLSNYRQRTSFTNTFVEAPLKHFRVSNFGVRQKRSNPRRSLMKTNKLRRNKKMKKEEKKKRKPGKVVGVEKRGGGRESVTEYKAPVPLHHSRMSLIRSIHQQHKV